MLWGLAMRQGFSEFSPSEHSIEDVNPALIRLWVNRASRIPEVARWLNDLIARPDAVRSPHVAVLNILGLGSRDRPEPHAETCTAPDSCRSLEVGTLFRNLRVLGKRLGWTLADRRILAFRVLLRLSEPLGLVMDEPLDGWTDAALHRRLSLILGLPRAAVERSLSPEGGLVQARLIRVGKVLTDTFTEKIGLPGGLIGVLMRRHKGEASLIAYLLRPVAHGSLTVADYPHLSREIGLSLSYLEAAGCGRKKGVNVLLYGPPGTGKTELPRALCKELGWTLYDVPPAYSDRSITADMPRLDALATIQNALRSSSNAAVLFDEVDQAISVALRADSDDHCGKQLVNELLESNPTPTFWITNHPRSIDPAFLRRFDMVISVGDPPRSVKQKLLTNAVSGMNVADSDWVSRKACMEGLTPALIDRFAQVARSVASAGGGDFVSSFELLLDQQFKVCNRRETEVLECHVLEHDAGALNASLELAGLAENVRAVGRARMLFHGLPGTGKSAFARALASITDRPLLSRQASDLLAPYLGETEQNIRHSFARASKDGAMLLIDEVDSFLQPRERAVRSWEIAQINEFLTQLECFDGVVVCTTNFMQNLDPAALRRFDVKVEFKPLQPIQALRLLRQLCDKAGIVRIPHEAECLARLGCLPKLTPGDFATVARRMRLVRPAHIEDLFDALAEEERLKPVDGGRPMGFVA